MERHVSSCIQWKRCRRKTEDGVPQADPQRRREAAKVSSDQSHCCWPPVSSLRRRQWGRSISSRTSQTPLPMKVEKLPSPTWQWCWWPHTVSTTHYSEHGLEWSRGKRRGGGKPLYCQTHWSPQRKVPRSLLLLRLPGALSPICEITQNSGRRRPNVGVVALEGTACILGKEHSDREDPSLPGTLGEGAEMPQRINSTDRWLNQGDSNLF